MEVEAKLSIPDHATFERLRELDELAGYRLETAAVKPVDDRYLDTHDRAILKAGYACRVRRKGGTSVVTLKGLGGADATSGIHQRAEYEVPVEADDPATWPSSPARDLAAQLSSGQPLRTLFSLYQERHQRLIYDERSGGIREVAELSLDRVTPADTNELESGGEPHTYYELEIELLEQGLRSDLDALVNELKSDLDLRPEPRSKFERGLALANGIGSDARQGIPMDRLLTTDERNAVQTWVESDSRPIRRRAQIVLLYDRGHDTHTIAAQVGLSERQVRRWLSAFRDKRIGIFPAHIKDAKPGTESQQDQIESAASAPVALDEPAPPVAITVEEVCARHGVDVARSNHVRDLALQLFDLTADIHRLSLARRSLLGIAATLFNLRTRKDRVPRQAVGRDVILAAPIVGLDETEQLMLANIVAFHRKKVRVHQDNGFGRLPDVLQHETLALAGLLRMAAALDSSKTQGTTIRDVEPNEKRLTVVLAGPAAEKDAATARRRSKLWHEQFAEDINFVTEGQLTQTALLGQIGLDPHTLPELESPGLLPADPMSEAGRKTLWFHFLRMLKHEPGTRMGADIEELHDMRVATRRMRAAIRVFGDFFEPQAIKPFNKGIRRVTQALGAVRDLDVFEEKATGYLQSLPEEARRGLDPLLETWHEERAAARAEMLAFLDSERYLKFKRDFAEFLQTEGAGSRPIPTDRPTPYQVRHVAPRLIYTRYETVRAYETFLEDAQIETLHALRIDCKYLRYTLEFLREVLGPDGEATIEEVKIMQDHLGDLNDAEVAIALLSEFLGDWDTIQAHVPLSQRRSVEGVVTYLASRHADKHRLLVTFPEAWTRLNRTEVRRWMALAIAAL